MSDTSVPPKSVRTPLKRSDPCMEIKTRSRRVVDKPKQLEDCKILIIVINLLSKIWTLV